MQFWDQHGFNTRFEWGPEGARLLAGAADGIMPWRGRPEILKRGLIARVPPIDFFEGTDE